MTGVSLQTLHPTKFDHGMVLAQTPDPGIKHECTTVPELMALLAPKGAELLVEGIKQGNHVPPLKEVGWCKNEKDSQRTRCAPKIQPSDRHIDWASWTAADIMRRHRVLGPLWNFANASGPERAHSRRVIWTSGFRIAKAGHQLSSEAGQPVVTSFKTDQDIYIKTCDGQILQADEVKLDGERNMGFLSAAKRAGMVDTPTDPLQCPRELSINLSDYAFYDHARGNARQALFHCKASICNGQQRTDTRKQSQPTDLDVLTGH
ncbi:MAG: hypothetical protein Q9191_004145 [Dirinaria sp. TL-2023a]